MEKILIVGCKKAMDDRVHRLQPLPGGLQPPGRRFRGLLPTQDAQVMGLLNCGDCPGATIVTRLAQVKLWNAPMEEKPTKVHIAPCIIDHCPHGETIINKIKAKWRRGCRGGHAPLQARQYLRLGQSTHTPPGAAFFPAADPLGRSGLSQSPISCYINKPCCAYCTWLTALSVLRRGRPPHAGHPGAFPGTGRDKASSLAGTDRSVPPSERRRIGSMARCKGLDRGGLAPSGLQGSLKRLTAAVNDFKPDVIHIHNVVDPALTGRRGPPGPLRGHCPGPSALLPRPRA